MIEVEEDRYYNVSREGGINYERGRSHKTDINVNKNEKTRFNKIYFRKIKKIRGGDAESKIDI